MISVIDGNQYKYTRIKNTLYLIKPLTNELPIILENLKPLFKVYTTSFKIVKDKRKYICYRLLRDNNCFYDAFSINYAHVEIYTKKFIEKLKNLIFFRAILGYNSTENSTIILYDGKACFPVNYTYTKQMQHPKTLGYKITNLSIGESAINPKIQLCKILKGAITRGRIEEFLEKIRKIIIKIDSKYLFLVNDIRVKLLEFME